MPSYPIGRLNGVDAEVGTILGPDSIGELLVVAERDEAGVRVSYAGVPDIEAARARVAEVGPRSMTELRMFAVGTAR